MPNRHCQPAAGCVLLPACAGWQAVTQRVVCPPTAHPVEAGAPRATADSCCDLHSVGPRQAECANCHWEWLRNGKTMLRPQLRLACLQ